MLVVGLIGGIASGKSFIASCFRELGAEVIDADQIGHATLTLPQVVDSIGNLWPESIDSFGRVDRTQLARIVFQSDLSSIQLAKLEKITHPIIGRQIDEQLDQFRHSGVLASILDAPIMLEAGWHRKCDRILFVEASAEVRKERALMRGWKLEQFFARENAQMPLEEKRKHASDFITNEADADQARIQVHKLWRIWGLGTPSEHGSGARTGTEKKHKNAAE